MSARLLGEAYCRTFCTFYDGSRRRTFKLFKDQLYDFLYDNDFDNWLLTSVDKLSAYSKRELPRFVMGLHTGTAVSQVTQRWSTEEREAFGQRVLGDLATAIFKKRESSNDPTLGQDAKGLIDGARKQLELDGYIFKSGVLLLPEESVLDDRDDQGVLDELLVATQLSDRKTIQHHLSLSEQHYRDELWDDSIGNSRKVLEAILSQAAVRVSDKPDLPELDPDALKSQRRVRNYLETVGLLEKKEKEAIQSCYGLLSETGAHPYIAAKDQARLLRHIALTFGQFVLLRLRGLLST